MFRFNETQHSDNCAYTGCLLFSGWIIGILLGLAIMLTGEIPTTAEKLVPLPTPTAPLNITTNMTVATELPSTVIEMNEEFEIAGTALLTIGLLLSPVAFIAIILWRRIRNGDVWSEDKLGLGIALTGLVSGVIFIIGVLMLSGFDTEDKVALGVFLLIVTIFGVPTLLMLSKCYNHYYEEQEGKFY